LFPPRNGGGALNSLPKSLKNPNKKTRPKGEAGSKTFWNRRFPLREEKRETANAICKHREGGRKIVPEMFWRIP
jgi:hypothetical protein